MSFKPIETQEELDEVIKDRLARENKKYEGWTSPDKLQGIKDGIVHDTQKQFEGFTSPEDLQTIKNGYESQIASLKATELRTKVANEFKLPSQMASRLQGSTEEELRADAKALSELVPNNGPVVLPLHSGQNEGDSEREAALKELLSQLKGE